MHGRIKMYNADKGYGFIIGEDGNDYFFHISKVKSVDMPETGLKVDFELDRNEKGLFASDVHITMVNGGRFIKLGNVRLKANNIKDYGISEKEVYYQKVYQWRYREGSSKLDKFFGTRYIDYIDTGEWYEINERRFNSIASGDESYYHVMKAKKGECIGRYYEYYDSFDSYNNVSADIYAPYDGVFDLNDSKYNWHLTKRNQKAGRGDVMKVTEEYLYITTYQGDNYVFNKSQADFNIHEKFKEIDEQLI